MKSRIAIPAACALALALPAAAQTTSFIRAEIDKYAKVIKATGVQKQ